MLFNFCPKSSSDQAFKKSVGATDETLASYRQKKETEINRFEEIKKRINQKQSAWGEIVKTLEKAQSHPEDGKIRKSIYASVYDLYEMAQKLKHLQEEWVQEDTDIYHGLELYKSSSFLKEIHKKLHSAEKDLERVLKVSNTLIDEIYAEVKQREIFLSPVKRSELNNIAHF